MGDGDSQLVDMDKPLFDVLDDMLTHRPVAETRQDRSFTQRPKHDIQTPLWR